MTLAKKKKKKNPQKLETFVKFWNVKFHSRVPLDN